MLAVAEELHFGRAAARMHISQPPLSMQIRNLEEELGVRLFNRTSRQVELTAAGKVFAKASEQILAELDRACERARQVDKGKTGHLVVGFVGPAMDTFLPGLIRGFRTAHPGIELTLEACGTAEQIQALEAKRLDIGFARLFQAGPDGIASRSVFKEPYVLAVPENHPFSTRKTTGLCELQGEPFIMYPRRSHPRLYDQFFACFERAGFTPNIVQEARTKQTTAALVAAGLGLAILPSSSRRLAQGMAILEIEDPLPKVDISMVWREKSTCSALTRLVEFTGSYSDLDPGLP